MLEYGALLVGAVVAVTLSAMGSGSIVSFWSALASSAVEAAPRAALACAAFLGFGSTVLRFLATTARQRLSRLELGFLAWVVGLLVTSQCLWVLGVLGLYRPPILLALQICGALALLAHLPAAPSPGRTAPGASDADRQAPRLALLALIGAVGGAYLAQALGTRLIHGDALQYHFGFPMWYLRLGGIEHFASHLMSGTYLGVDILYGMVLDPAEPLRTGPAKLLSWLLGSTGLLAVFLTALRLGASRSWALVAVLAMLTVPAIANWGSGKNDLAAAGAALAALWLLVVSLEEREPALSFWVGLCLGYAVTIKVTMGLVAFAVAPALTWLAGWRATARFALGCALAIMPWALTAWYFQGTPVYPFGINRPRYLQELWAVRNANGLTLSPGSFLRNAIPLLLDTDGRVAANDSIGVPFLVAALMAFPGCLRRRAAAVAWSAAVLLLAVGLVLVFEHRFQNRYFLLAPAVAFPVACAWISSWRSSSRWRATAPLVAAAVLMVSYAGADPSIFDSLARTSAADLTVSGRMPAGDRLSHELGLVRRAESLLDPGEVLLINDASIYLLSRKFVNAHALHSTVFRYDRLDAEGLARELRAHRVGAALIRTGISGLQPQLREVLARHGTPLAGPRRLRVYHLSWANVGDPDRVERTPRL